MTTERRQKGIYIGAPACFALDMELCDACMREVVSNAASKLGLSQREG